MSLFRRIKTPFDDIAGREAPQPEWPVHSVGRMLRQRREELGLDLEAAGAALRIRPIYLAALEQDRAEDLPGPTYVVGFIRAYAHYLGYDGPRVLERYKAESAAGVQLRPDLSFPVPLAERSLPGGRLLLVAAIVALCGYGTWYYLSTGTRFRPERVAAVPAALEHQAAMPVRPPQAPSAAPAAAESPEKARLDVVKTGAAAPAAIAPSTVAPAANAPAVAATPAARDDGAIAASVSVSGPSAPAARDDSAIAAPAAVPPPSPPAAATTAAAAPSSETLAGRIDISATADCWIQVRDGNQVLLSRVLKPGETYRVPRPGLTMRVGNAGALTINVGGKAAPALGPLGALRRDVVLDPQALLDGTAVRG